MDKAIPWSQCCTCAQEISCPMKEFSWFCCHSIFLDEISFHFNNTGVFPKFNQPTQLNIDRKVNEMMIYSGVSYLFWEWNRTPFNLMIFRGLDTQPLTWEKEKSSVRSVLYWVFQKPPLPPFAGFLQIRPFDLRYTYLPQFINLKQTIHEKSVKVHV